MADEHMPHKLCLNERRQLTMTGVTEVVSFDDTTVVLQTSLGTLIVQGKELQLKTLSLEGGQVEVDGSVSALAYEEPRQAAGWKRRLFGCPPPRRPHTDSCAAACWGQRWGCITNSYVPCVHGILLPRTRCF